MPLQEKKEAGTLRITLANALPRDILLWSKLIGGYLVFIVPFLVSLITGLLVLVWQGFPLSESDIFPSVLCLIGISLLYIAVFFAMGGGDLNLFRQFQDSTHRRLYLLGVRCPDFTPGWVSRGTNRRTDFNSGERL